MKIGFTTTTFRQIRDLQKIVDLAVESKIDCIEWGGDIHIKNKKDAEYARKICDEAGISVCSYASYYRIGSFDPKEQKRICEIASILGASAIRVWLGKRNSEKTDEQTYISLVKDAKAFCSIAKEFGLIICPECHDNTFNNNTDAFLKIQRDISCDNFRTYFQSRYKKQHYDLDRIERTLPFIESVHISYSEMRREQFPKYDKDYIDILLAKLCDVGFNGNLLLEYTYLCGRFGMPLFNEKGYTQIKIKGWITIMKIAMLGTNSTQFNKVFTDEVLSELKNIAEISPKINKKNIYNHVSWLEDCEIAFSTWGMPKFTEDELEKYLPNLKAVFYCAGTVQYFARPFLNRGIRVFSAFAANAVPVAEYTSAQILLATKGFFQASKNYRPFLIRSFAHANASPGNFKCKVGLVGLGAIGSLVAKRLTSPDIKLYAYDPFISNDKAKELNVTLVDLPKLFSECDVISNHLANKSELNNIFNYSLFRKMKKHSTFINTGRGAQVNEYSLALSLILHPSHTFVGDVIKHEYFPYINPLFWCHNAILTPHIAGSTGNEPQRMAYYMIDELQRFLSNDTPLYEVTIEALERMA